MDIAAYDQRKKQLELRETLVEIEELRRADMPETMKVSVHSDCRMFMIKKSPLPRVTHDISYIIFL